MEKLAEFKRILFELLNLIIDTPLVLAALGGLIFIAIVFRLGYNLGLKRAKK